MRRGWRTARRATSPRGWARALAPAPPAAARRRRVRAGGARPGAAARPARARAPPSGRALVATAVAQSELDVLQHGKMREQRVVLHDHADPPALGGRETATRPGHAQHAPTDGDLTRVGTLKTHDQPQQGRFTAARRPEYAKQLASLDRRPTRARSGDRLTEATC